MPKQSQRVELNRFIKGVITEASPLNFPDNASMGEENFELRATGSRERRLGMDYEDGWAVVGSKSALYSDVPMITTYKWTNIKGYPTSEFIVMQEGDHLLFFDAAADALSSASGYLGSIGPLASLPLDKRASFAAVDGFLVVTAGSPECTVITYNGGTSFTASSYRLKTRDLWGVQTQYTSEDKFDYRLPSGGGIGSPPTVPLINQYDTYNLRNQSWGIPRIDLGGGFGDLIGDVEDQLAVFPSHADMVWTGLSFDGASREERFYPRNIISAFAGRQRAAKGYFIIDLLDRGASRLNAVTLNNANYPGIFNRYPITSLPSDYTLGGPTCVEEHSGRVFYAGFGDQVLGGDDFSPNLANYVAFSQLVKDKTHLERCYQAGDPTSRDDSDIIATDGGLIRVAGAERIIALRDVGSALMVIATNGIWAIMGNDKSGFSATGYMTNKITDKGCIAVGSLIEDNGVLFYWAEDGIYAVDKNEFGDYRARNLTEDTIQSYYLSIPINNMDRVQSAADPYERKIRWLWMTNTPLLDDNAVKELIFDLRSGAFTFFSIQNTALRSPEVVAYAQTSKYAYGSNVQTVQVGTDVVEAGGQTVQVADSVRSSTLRSLKYVTLTPRVPGGYIITFSHYRDFDFLDWKSDDGVGVDAKAWMMAGVSTAGDSSIHKQIPYLFMHFYRTEDGVVSTPTGFVPDKQSSCLVRTQWDWSNSVNSGKWSGFFQAYRYNRPYLITNALDPYDTGYETVVSRNKIRGRGRAFTFYLETEPGKDCRILGWNINVNANSVA